MTTNDPPSAKKLGPAEIGASTYSVCAGCHGAAGGGSGAFPALTNVATVFPTPWEQVRWVMLGTEGFQKEGLATYGATKKAVKGSGNNMPPQLETLTAEKLLAVVRHERTVFGKEKFNIKAWEEIPTKMAADSNAAIKAKAAAYKTVIDEWKATGA